MHYVQKYLEKYQLIKTTNNKMSNGSNTNIYLYCNYYSFYSQKVCI